MSKIKEQVLVSVEEAICLSEMTLEDILNGHKWQHKKWKDNKVLDSASKCFKNNLKIREIRATVKRMRNEDRIAEKFKEFDREYAWVEKDLEELMNTIKGL